MLHTNRNIALVVNPLYSQAQAVADSIVQQLKQRKIEQHIYCSSWPTHFIAYPVCQMKPVLILFPNPATLTEFLLRKKLSKIEACSLDVFLKGALTNEQFKSAYAEYGAQVHMVNCSAK